MTPTLQTQHRQDLERHRREGRGVSPAFDKPALLGEHSAAITTRRAGARLLRDSRRVQMSPVVVGTSVLAGASFSIPHNLGADDKLFAAIWIEASIGVNAGPGGTSAPNGRARVTANFALLPAGDYEIIGAVVRRRGWTDRENSFSGGELLATISQVDGVLHLLSFDDLPVEDFAPYYFGFIQPSGLHFPPYILI